MIVRSSWRGIARTPGTPNRRCAGLTLIEAMLSIVLLGITSTGVSMLFNTGLNSLSAAEEVVILENALQSQMEVLISRPFSEVLSEGAGARVVVANGVDHDLTWTVKNRDLDGDGNPEHEAMEVTVTLEGRSLSVLLVDDDDRMGVVP